MHVTKRDGRTERMMIDKITSRLEKLCYDLNAEPSIVTLKTIRGIYPGIPTAELDHLSAEIAASMTTKHPDFAILAARIAVSNLHKETKKNFSRVIRDLHEDSQISKETLDVVAKHSWTLNSAIVHHRDFRYNYFGFKTLEKSYLLKIKGKTVERPQHMLMRVAVGVHGDDLDAVLETYELMSERYFVHATPTLFNAGTVRPQLSSCFLMTLGNGDEANVCDAVTKCVSISSESGGIGLSVHGVRSDGRLIPMLRIFDNLSHYVDRGEGKRPGAFAMYLEPWHVDAFDFLELRKNTGIEERRCRNLFHALWIPDLFMRRVDGDREWSLMCPGESPGLDETWGKDFDELYERYEREGRYRRRVPARELWDAIVRSQIETGTPFVMYKDACNAKSNQRHLGTIKGSNLCTEIVEYSSSDEVAVCNLASIALNRFVRKSFDFGELKRVTKIVTRNLNKIIDATSYPVAEARISNLRHRPIGIGVQGLADAFLSLRLPFDCAEARLLNRQIFETIYHSALEASCELAAEFGPHESYPGSPASEGILQYDMWDGVEPTDLWDWTELKEKIAKHGLRNSLLVALMPTASTAQILGNNESIEPYTSNVYTRRVLSGEFQVVNPHLLRDLTERGLWDEDAKNELVAANGSVQRLERVPPDLKLLYRTNWEIPQRHLLEMAADRGAFVDQSQSLNVHVAEPVRSKISSMHFAGWRLGLKTGMYYLRTKPAANAIQFTVDKKCLTCQA